MLPSRPTTRTLLIDDEAVAIHRLKQSLAAYPSIEVIGEAMDGLSAVQQINSLRPDLIFLDIQMPGLDGFDVLNRLTYMPMVVFVTAYEEYAVKAFERHSLDYLLKPVEEERLAMTVQRVLQQKRPEADLVQQLQQLLREERPASAISTIPVKAGNKIQLVQVGDVCFFEAEDKYVNLHTKDAVRLIEYPLSYLEDRLPPFFIRVHRSYIVNKLMIREIQKHFKGTFLLVMNDAKGTHIKCAYSYSEVIRKELLAL